jgi:steroid delta-isomerase-like uncharacterized protein
MSEENKALARLVVEELWNQYRLELLEKHYSSNCVRHDPAGVGSAEGIEGIKQVATGLRTAFPDGRYTIEDLISEKEKLVMMWTFRGTNTGELMGRAPTGKKVEATGINISRMEDGKIVEDRIVWDALGFMRQLGFVSLPGEI